MKGRKIDFDFVTMEQSAKVERNDAVQLQFFVFGEGTAILNGNLNLGIGALTDNGWKEDVKEGEYSTTEYSLKLTGTAKVLVVRKYYID